jgi:putative peptide zinc metalloprotease protein
MPALSCASTVTSSWPTCSTCPISTNGPASRPHLAATALAGLDEPWPERLPPGQHAGLIAFALVTWLYRLGVFIGIAVAVYYMFFKALGILLFLVEIGWFVLRPLIVEMREWRSRRNDIPVPANAGPRSLQLS